MENTIFYETRVPWEGAGEYVFFLTDSLEKVFPNQRPRGEEEPALYALQGETPALQFVYRYEPGPERAGEKPAFSLEIEGSPVPVRLRRVSLVPSDYPCNEARDENYLTHQPGLFPDLLLPMEDGGFRPVHWQYRAVWVDFPDLKAQAGEYRLCAVVKADGKEAARLPFTLHVAKAALPPQKLLHTEWIHGDCLADYYRVQVFSEEHWAILENFIAVAGREHRVNVLLTPVFTPPLDTAKGGERTTIQLVEVYQEKNGYRFGFSRLERWCGLCRKYGITHLEISHLFTQWGAEAIPKIMAHTPEGEKQIFGWDTPADSPEYRRFLEAFLPALCQAVQEFGYDKEHVLFHASDEPNAKLNYESYTRAHHMLTEILGEGWKVVDALSDFDFYAKGVVETPIVSSDHIHTFLEHNVRDLWVYYCTGQCVKVPNRFFAMPSARNRIMGVLMYVSQVKGFLQWGYNFYNTQYSLRQVDPFADTSAGSAFPSGDAFLVYPGADGKPCSSIRAEVQRQGIDDLRALTLLEELAGRDEALRLIHEGADSPFTYEEYPQDAAYLLGLHRRLCQRLEELSGR